MKDPLEYLEHINFNTNKFPQYNHVSVKKIENYGLCFD